MDERIPGKLSEAVDWARIQRHTLTGVERDAVVQQYALAREDVQHDDERRWALFGAFLVAETLLATLLPDQIKDWIVAVLGLASTLLMGLAIWRNHVYLKDRSMMTTVLEELVGPTSATVRFYDRHAQIADARLRWQHSYGLLKDHKESFTRTLGKDITAWFVIRTTLYGAGAAWFVFLVSSVPFPWSSFAEACVLWVLSLMLCGVVGIDACLELSERRKRAIERAQEGSLGVRDAGS